MNALMTDLYQLTMSQFYFNHKEEYDGKTATFDMFVRKLPQTWQYFIASGIQDAINKIAGIEFTSDDIAYLKSTGIFQEDFLEYLRNWKPSVEINGVLDGTLFLPNEPILTISGPMIDCQMLETLILNTVNFQTMICTKAKRIVDAANGKPVIDFGMRRAQGPEASILASKNCYLAGCIATSNVEAARLYNIPPSGTMAHSLVMSYGEERQQEAFVEFAKMFGKNSVLLVDTYNIYKGILDAIEVAQKYEIKGIRIDSGNILALAQFAKNVAVSGFGMKDFKVYVSNDLNEDKIREFECEDSKAIDGYGVGTEMVTAKPVAAISGVYKLVEFDGKPTSKFSEDKVTIGGRKHVIERRTLHEILHATILASSTRTHDIPINSIRYKENGKFYENYIENRMDKVRERITEYGNLNAIKITQVMEEK